MYPFVDAFTNPQGSPIRELFKYLSKPGMISFSGGSPASELFDVEGLAKAARSAFENKEACLQYGATGGSTALRRQVIHLMGKRGVRVDESELLITTGSQQGLDLLVRILIEPSDVVYVDEPAYPATVQAFRLAGATIVPMSSDEHGLNIDALEEQLESGEVRPRPKLIYTVPTFANPTGATISRERRLRLLEIARRYEVLLVEDDPYSELRFSGEGIPTMLSLSEEVSGSREWVVHLSSLSKIVAPGLRVGWTVGPAEIVRRCVIAKQTADLCSPPWTQEIAASYMRDEDLGGYVQQVTAVYGAKCRAMCEALRSELGDRIEFGQPEGGLFVWARFTGNVDTAKLLTKAIEQNVIFVPGTAFYAKPQVSSALRLSYATASIDDIQEGLRRLARALANLED